MLHASRVKTKRECAWSCDCKNAMWPRETTARSGDIGAAIRSPPARPMASRFAAEHCSLCRSEKREVFGCLRGGCCADSQAMPSASGMWNTKVEVLTSDVAARDVQAATSPAYWIANARTKSWRFAGDGPGLMGKGRRGKGQFFDWPENGASQSSSGVINAWDCICQSVWITCRKVPDTI